MAGDQTLFLREDAVERSWEIVTPVLGASNEPVTPIRRGDLGPERRGHPDRAARMAAGLNASAPPRAAAAEELGPDAARSAGEPSNP